MMLDHGCFEKNANVKFLMHSSLTFKQIYRMFSTAFDYERENWTIIGDKNIFDSYELFDDNYSIMEYDHKWIDYPVANLSTKQKNNTPKQNIIKE